MTICAPVHTLCAARSSTPAPCAAQEIQRFCSVAQPRSTLVVVGGVLDYHEPCSRARAAGLCVERVYGSNAPRRIVEASRAHWHASFADVLREAGLPDWRHGDQDMAAVRFRSSLPRGAPTPPRPARVGAAIPPFHRLERHEC